MRTMIIVLLATLGATSAFAVTDPDPDVLGFYFDRDAQAPCTHAAENVPFFAYLILTNPTANSINAYELGLELVVPSGMEGSIFRLSSTIANGVVSGVDVGTNDALGGDFIVGLATPLPADQAMILHSFQYILLQYMVVAVHLGASSTPSIPGDLPVVQDAEGSILMQVGVFGGNPDFPVAGINDYSLCPLPIENASFGSVKSLYR